MGKYEQLGQHLRNQGSNSIELSFNEIEEILGFPLPKSAYKYRPWWANDENHVQARDGWISVGYNSAAVNLDDHTISFIKVGEPENLPNNLTELSGEKMTPIEFEKVARIIMSQYFDLDLSPGKMDDWPKLFDMVSDDFSVVGDAKYLSMVRGQYVPSAKLSVISEHVWMLDKLEADVRFLTFGNDTRVPKEWLKRYSSFLGDVEFFFISDDGKLTQLSGR